MLLIRFILFLTALLPTGALLAQKNPKPADLRVILPNVQFTAEKAAIQPDAADELDDVAALLKKSPAVTLEVGAHTDASGSASYNLRLSQRRAQAVSNYLVKRGIAQKRIRFKGYGETQPLNRCRRGVRCTEAEKRQNRRVELRVSGVPADSAVQAQWLALGGIRNAAPTARPVVQKAPPPVPVFAQQAAAVPAPVSEPVVVAGLPGDYFPELKGAKQHVVPQPLPNTFTGYTVEISCVNKPLAPGHPVLQAFDQVWLRQEAGGQYCYFIGAFHTLPEARQYLTEKILPRISVAKVVAFANNEKKYLSN